MGIRFTCRHCGHQLNVKDPLAGKRGICPRCRQVVDIPTQSETAPGEKAAGAGTAMPAAVGGGSAGPGGAAAGGARSAPEAKSAAAGRSAGPSAADTDMPAIAEAPHLQWYVMPPGGAGQYGPASGDTMRQWIFEGRVAGDALVWRQDWPEWKRAGSVFPLLERPGQPAGEAQATVVRAAATAIPTAAGAPFTAAGALPVAMPAAAPGTAAGQAIPVASPLGAPTSFPLAAVGPAGIPSAAARVRRRRSNVGPVIAIVVLLVAMIPLSYMVWKVVNEQLIEPDSPPSGSAGVDG